MPPEQPISPSTPSSPMSEEERAARARAVHLLVGKIWVGCFVFWAFIAGTWFDRWADRHFGIERFTYYEWYGYGEARNLVIEDAKAADNRLRIAIDLRHEHCVPLGRYTPDADAIWMRR